MKRSKQNRAAFYTRRFIAVSSMFSFLSLFFVISTYAGLATPAPVPSAVGIAIENTPNQDGIPNGSQAASDPQGINTDTEIDNSDPQANETQSTFSSSIEQYVEAVLSTVPQKTTPRATTPPTTTKPVVTSPPTTQPRQEADHEDEEDDD